MNSVIVVRLVKLYSVRVWLCSSCEWYGMGDFRKDNFN